MANFAALEARTTAAAMRHLANATATFTGDEPAPCIFDASYDPAGVGGVGMASAQPMLTIASASVPADPVGTGVTVRGVAYVVTAAEPDGTGITRLMLERAP